MTAEVDDGKKSDGLDLWPRQEERRRSLDPGWKEPWTSRQYTTFLSRIPQECSSQLHSLYLPIPSVSDIPFEISYGTPREIERSTSPSYFSFHLTIFRRNLATIVSGSCDFDIFPGGGVLNVIAVHSYVYSPAEMLTLLHRPPLPPLWEIAWYA